MDYIIKKTSFPQPQQYLVKWTAKKHSENSWLSKQKLSQTPQGLQLLANFQQAQNPAPQSNKKSSRNQQHPRKYRPQNNTILLPELKINLPCLAKERAHWIFGDRVESILGHNSMTKFYKVLWNNGEESWESEEEMLDNQAQIICLYLEKELQLQ